MNIYKIYYDWYEGEHEEALLAKDVEFEQFEKDIIEAKKFAESISGIRIDWNDKESYVGRGYAVECLPEYFEQIIWYLTTKLGYIQCYIDEDVSYKIDDDSYTERPCVSVEKKVKEIKWTPLGKENEPQTPEQNT